MFAIWINQSSKAIAINYATADTSTLSGTNGSGRHTYTKEGNNFYLDGKLIYTNSTSFQSSYPLYLFALNGSNQSADQRNSAGKLYYAKIYDNGTLVRDFIPVLNTSGVPGLYDTVNGKFYTNSGAGTFGYESVTYPTSYNTEGAKTLPTPVRPGYTFGGWYDNSSLTGSGLTQIPKGAAGNKTLYAKWTLTPYTISYT